MKPKIIYNNEPFYLQTSGRYYQSGRKTVAERLLHRRIWIDNNGPIPDGYLVHHIDGDWTNNNITNLMLVTRQEHADEHPVPDRRFPDSATERAAAWHKTEEGRASNRENALIAWGKKESITRNCNHCGTTYNAYFERSKFCSRRCMQANAAKNQRYKTLERVCPQCGSLFMTNRHTPAVCCSRACNNRLKSASR